MAWETMLSIVHEAIEYVRDEQHTPPTACPHDGEPLRQGPDQELYCPLGNYSWPRERRII